MSDFWNERYATGEYAYGTEPNKYVREKLSKIVPGKILFPAEGEGRNAVFAATLGWKVSAFDVSTEGKRKAEQLAAANNVEIDYQIAGFDEVQFTSGTFDCVVLVFAHMHPLKRTEFHRKLVSFLKPGSILILEGFSKKQLQYNSGGPREITMLFSEEELRADFEILSELNIEETDIVLDEGPFHQGKAAVIRVLGRK